MKPMYEHAMSMFKDSVDAFVREDVDLGRALVPRDDKLDELNRLASRKLIQRMAEDPNQLRGYLNLMFIARHLERVGDHAHDSTLLVGRQIGVRIQRGEWRGQFGVRPRFIQAELQQRLPQRVKMSGGGRQPAQRFRRGELGRPGEDETGDLEVVAFHAAGRGLLDQLGDAPENLSVPGDEI